ncbi:Nn.00g118060.m01.CDS01 [Neocucurbitaria sp. VM-36]
MNHRRRLQARDYTVGWICALPIELAAAQEMLDEVDEPIPDNLDPSVYTLGRINVHNVVVACLPGGNTGTQSAATVAARMKFRFTSIRFGLMVGIGGGVPSVESDIRLGDVVISQPYQQHGGVVQYDFGKTEASGHTIRTGWLNAPPPVLLSAIVEQRARHIRRQSDLESYLSKFKRLETFSREAAGRDVLFQTTYDHVGGATCNLCANEMKIRRPGRMGTGVGLHYGTIASGNQVMKDATRRDQISKELGGVMCFEMEAAGLMNDFPCLVIRGICDYADSHKNKTWQPYAAATAAACAREILSIVPGLPRPTVARNMVDETVQSRIEMKLDQFMSQFMTELQLGYKTPAQFAQDLQKNLVDDDITEVDIEENRDIIDEWLKNTEDDGWLPELGPAEEKKPSNIGMSGMIDHSSSHDSKGVPQKDKSTHSNPYQAFCQDEGSGNEDQWSDNNDDSSDAETEVPNERQTPSPPPVFRRASNSKLRSQDPKKQISAGGALGFPSFAKNIKKPSGKSKSERERTQGRRETEIDDKYEEPQGSSGARPKRRPHSTRPQSSREAVPERPSSNPFNPRHQNDQSRDDPQYHGESTYLSTPGRYAEQPYPYSGGYSPGYNEKFKGHHHAAPPLAPHPTNIPSAANGAWNPYDGPYDDAYDRYAPPPSGHAQTNDSRTRAGPQDPYAVYTSNYDQYADPRPTPPQPPPPTRSFHFSTSDQAGGGFKIMDVSEMFDKNLRMRRGGDDFGINSATARAQQSSDTEITIVEKPLLVSLEDLFYGTTKKMKIKRKTYDRATSRQSIQDRILEVPVKRGLKAGSKIKFADVGDQVPGGSQDLHYIVTEKPHALFRRDGDNLHHTFKINIQESLLGWERRIVTIDGEEMNVASREPTGPSWKGHYVGYGMPKSKSPTERGALVVSVDIIYPASLTQSQKDAIRKIFEDSPYLGRTATYVY